jgi:hypothetical protein
MKKMACCALATGLVLGAGCSKENEDGTKEMMTVTEIAEQTQETAVQVTEETQKVVSILTVKTEEVMSDLNKTVDEVKQKVASLDQNHIMAYAETYKTVILEKKEQLTALTEQLKSLSAMEIIGEKGKALKAEVAKYTEQLTALKDRYGIYVNKLKELGVDLSAYGY